MGRPPKDLDKPELHDVAAKKAKLDEKLEAAADARKEYDDAVVVALNDHGLRTLAKVAQVSTDAIRHIREKRAAGA